MNKNLKTFSKIGGLGLVGVLGLGAGGASAVEFNASADVQNALAVTVVQDMNFGTLFAAKANSSAISSIQLAPNGDIAVITGLAIGGGVGDAPSFLTLGGGVAAARGSVATSSNFTLTVPNLPRAGLKDGSGVFDSAGGVVVQVSSDPSEPAFYLTDFTVGDPVGATIVAGSGPGEFDVDPGFEVPSVEFGIGATINTDGAGGVRTAYQAATYTGTFEVTASF
jgi:hypothetical protein